MITSADNSSFPAHAGASFAVLNSWFHFLPDVLGTVATLLAVAWYALQLFESRTFQNWWAKRKARKLDRLRAEVMKLETEVDPKIIQP